VSHIDEIEVDQRLTSGRSPSAHAGSRLSPYSPSRWSRLSDLPPPERTATMYRSHYTRFIAPSLSRKRLAKILGSDITALIGQLRDDGYAEWSINGIVSVLRHVLRFARPEFMSTTRSPCCPELVCRSSEQRRASSHECCV
jgi:hypothetical protein